MGEAEVGREFCELEQDGEVPEGGGVWQELGSVGGEDTFHWSEVTSDLVRTVKSLSTPRGSCAQDQRRRTAVCGLREWMSRVAFERTLPKVTKTQW